jgi:putative transposase
MKKALKAKIRGLKKPQFERLKELTSHAKNLYNQTLWTLREAYDATGLYFSFFQMDKAMKQVPNLQGQINYQLLKAKVAQQTLRKLDKNFKSFFSLHQRFKQNPSKYKGRPKPPRFKPKPYDNLIYTYQGFQIKTRLEVLNHGFKIGTVTGPNGQTWAKAEVICRKDVVVLEKGLEIRLPKPLRDQPIKQLEIIPKSHCFQAVFVYEEVATQLLPPPSSVAPSNRVMAIDLGLNNLATCVTNGVIQPLIIDGRRLKSINAYYNKRKAKLQSALASRGQKWSHQLQSLSDWRYAAINNYLHRASHQVVKTCITQRIAKVVVGDITQSLHRINLGKRTNQNFVNLSLGQFIEKLRYKLGLHDIELVVTDESYTSKASFVDGDRLPKKYNPKRKKPPIFRGKRVKRGLYKAADGTLVNADVNGAYNILRKTDNRFSFASLVNQVGTKVKAWLHPTQRIRFLKHKNQQKK